MGLGLVVRVAHGVHYLAGRPVQAARGGGGTGPGSQGSSWCCLAVGWTGSHSRWTASGTPATRGAPKAPAPHLQYTKTSKQSHHAWQQWAKTVKVNGLRTQLKIDTNHRNYTSVG